MMMTDMEAPAIVEQPEAVKPDDATPRDQTSVGVLGWLGFIIINFAAWGMITLSSSISWIFGFFICLIYTIGLIGLAEGLELKGQKYHQFQNLLWVLGCWFVLILGVYFSVQVIGNGGIAGSSSSSSGISGSIPPIPGDGKLASLLPTNASADLHSWANEDEWRANLNPTYATFEDNIYFSGTDGTGGARLMHSTGNSLNKVTPSVRDARSFLEYRSSLFFVAQQNAFAGESLWRIGKNNLSFATSIALSGGRLYDLFVDQGSDTLYIKSGYQCPHVSQYVWVETVFRTDGTTEGTQDLRGEPCASISDGTEGDHVSIVGDGKPNVGVFWGVLFLGDIPMMALACFIFLRKKMPGLFVNLYGGIHCAVIVMYLLINYNNSTPSVSLSSFIKWFTTIFTSTLWVGIVLPSSLKLDLSEWQEELKSWAVAVVGVSFFVIIHVDLEVPFRQDWWRWVIYALLTVAQMAISMVVSRSVPMVAGALGTFIIAGKIAFELVQLTGIEGAFAMLTGFALFALQGVGIILLAIYYAGRRAVIDEMVRRAVQFRESKMAEPIGPSVVDEQPQ